MSVLREGSCQAGCRRSGQPTWWNRFVHRCAGAALAAVLATTPGAVRADEDHHHEGDFIVGVNGSGQLAMEADTDEQFFLPAASGLLNGWALDDPGFMALEEDEPAEDFYQLGAGAEVVLEVLAISPAFQAWTPGFINVLDVSGDQWSIGGNSFDEHPTWHINSDSLAFDPSQTKWSITFRLIDLGSTGYSPSEPVTAVFTNVDPDQPIPTVSEWGLIIMGLLLLTGGVVVFGRERTTQASDIV